MRRACVAQLSDSALTTHHAPRSTHDAQVSDSTLLRLQTQMNPESLAASSCEARADYKGHDFATGAAPV